MNAFGPVAASGSVFTPVSLGATVALVSTTITGKSDGDRVTTWTGMPGTSTSATTGSTGPLYKTGIANGKPILRFSGADGSNLLTVASVFAAEPYTIMIVRNYPGPTARRVLGGSNNWLLGGWQGNDQSFYAGGLGTVLGIGGSPSSTFELHTAVATGGTATYWINGASIGTDTTAYGSNGLIIGGDVTFGDFSDCDVAAVIGFPSALSSGDRMTVEAWLAGIFGITI